MFIAYIPYVVSNIIGLVLEASYLKGKFLSWIKISIIAKSSGGVKVNSHIVQTLM